MCFVFVKDAQGNMTKHDTCFEFKTVGQQLSEIDVDWAFYSAVPASHGYFWNAYNGIRDVFHSDMCTSTCSGRQHRQGHPGEQAARRHVGDTQVRALRPPAAVDGFSPQLGHRHRERRDDQRRVGTHRDLPHLGRVGRLLRPDLCRRSSTRSVLGIRVPLVTISPYTQRGVIDTDSASSPRRCGSSPTTGVRVPDAAHR
jgi:hypothetical protein